MKSKRREMSVYIMKSKKHLAQILAASINIEMAAVVCGDSGRPVMGVIPACLCVWARYQLGREAITALCNAKNVGASIENQSTNESINIEGSDSIVIGAAT